MKITVYLSSMLLVFVFNKFLFVNALRAPVVDTSLTSLNDVVFKEEHKLNIIFNKTVFKEITTGVLQVIGNTSNVVLNCESSMSTSRFLSWVYHGIKMEEARLKFYKNMVQISKFILGPPVLRMECIDKYNSTAISNSKLIYRGDGHPPFLHNHGKTLPTIIVNESFIYLPCLLNYPLDGQDIFQLQLYQDGVEVVNTTNSLVYTPELGFHLNLNEIKQPLGQYECRVPNSTYDDFVRIDIRNDDFLKRDIQVEHSLHLTKFFKGDPQKRVFHCKVPKAKFQRNFEWFYLLKDGTYTRIKTEKGNSRQSGDILHYTDSVKFNFPDANITHVVCAAYLKDILEKYSNSYPVNIEEPIYPKILNNVSTEPIYYSKGMNLSCESKGNPVDFTWLKNGEPINGLSTETWYNTPITKSLLYLKPNVDDLDSNYTCIAENFLGRDEINFRVKLREPHEKIATVKILFQTLFNVSVTSQELYNLMETN